jgi:hypothetical protein
MQYSTTGRVNQSDVTDFDEEDIDEAFVDAVRAAAAESGTALSYVVPLSEIYGEPADDGPKCLVIAVPASSRDINFRSERVYADVRLMPDGEYDACLNLADGKVALSERVLWQVKLRYDDDLTVLWVFDSAEYLWSHRYTDEMRDDMGMASRIAEALNHPPKAEHSGVFELFATTTR